VKCDRCGAVNRHLKWCTFRAPVAASEHRIAVQAIAHEIAALLTTHMKAAVQIDTYETNTGLQQISLQLGETKYHLTVTKARQQ